MKAAQIASGKFSDQMCSDALDLFHRREHAVRTDLKSFGKNIVYCMCSDYHTLDSSGIPKKRIITSESGSLCQCSNVRINKFAHL